MECYILSFERVDPDDESNHIRCPNIFTDISLMKKCIIKILVKYGKKLTKEKWNEIINMDKHSNYIDIALVETNNDDFIDDIWIRIYKTDINSDKLNKKFQLE